MPIQSNLIHPTQLTSNLPLIQFSPFPSLFSSLHKEVESSSHRFILSVTRPWFRRFHLIGSRVVSCRIVSIRHSSHFLFYYLPTIPLPGNAKGPGHQSPVLLPSHPSRSFPFSPSTYCTHSGTVHTTNLEGLNLQPAITLDCQLRDFASSPHFFQLLTFPFFQQPLFHRLPDCRHSTLLRPSEMPYDSAWEASYGAP